MAARGVGQSSGRCSPLDHVGHVGCHPHRGRLPSRQSSCRLMRSRSG
jgi:hypothetical protein